MSAEFNGRGVSGAPTTTDGSNALSDRRALASSRYDEAAMLLEAAQSSEMSNILKRIQERTHVLDQERAALQQAEHDEQVVQADLVELEKSHRQVRRQFLERQRRSHGYELEYYNMLDQENAQQRSNAIMEHEMAAWEASTAEQRNAWNASGVDELMAQHQTEMHLYEQYMQSNIDKMERAQSRQREMQRVLPEKLTRLEHELAVAQQQKQQLQDTLQSYSQREDELAQHVSDVAVQVRAAIAQRTELRTTLRDLQKQHQDANEEMLELERQCAEGSTRASPATTTMAT